MSPHPTLLADLAGSSATAGAVAKATFRLQPSELEDVEALARDLNATRSTVLRRLMQLGLEVAKRG